jgi:hypothetical protein
MNRRVSLPPPVAKIYEAVADLEARYPGRKFTPDGHLIGSLGEVIAAEVLKLTLHPASHPEHDAFDDGGNVQIKMTGLSGRSVSLYGPCKRLVVLKIVSPREAEIVYDGPGEPVWEKVGGKGKQGQYRVQLSTLRQLREQSPTVAAPTTATSVA